MHIYRCDLTLMEATFFSSREVSNLYQTEPLIGNYALAYAFRLCRSPYFNSNRVQYQVDLARLNAAGVYVTPATLLNQPQFILRQFNAQTDTYWSAFGQGFIANDPSGNFRATNRPQHGRIRMLAIGNQARCYVISQTPQDLHTYIRLGKFMSKAKVDIEEVRFSIEERDHQAIAFLLNPADLPAATKPRFFDLVNVPPMPLIRNAILSGSFYRISQDEWLPVGMTFSVGGET